jgi:hypothetical protein
MEDIKSSTEIKLPDFEQRSLLEKIFERGASLISRVL